MGAEFYVAETLEVFLLIVGIFALSLVGGVVAQKRHEADLSKRLGKIFEDKKKK